MPISEQDLKETLITELTAAGFKLDSAPMTKAFCDAIAKAVVSEVKKATVITPQGPGTLQ